MLTQLSVSNLRNITDLSLLPAPTINVIKGENGSGKTTLLEAIYLLGMGRSFRTRSLKNAIQVEQQWLQITAQTSSQVPVGLRYDTTSGLEIRLNRGPLQRLSDLAVQLPLLFVPANCHQFFEQGPRYRRQLLDWGLFHVEPSFNSHWQAYKKILQQRNSALRQHSSTGEVQLWDTQLAEHGEIITHFRIKQLEQLLTKFSELFVSLCPEFKGALFTLKYRNGWNKDVSLAESLINSLEVDKRLSYTRCGCHAADWMIQLNKADPLEVFSRGQQKLFYLALCMVQSNIVWDKYHNKSMLLIDDISSELDNKHLQNVFNALLGLAPSVQMFLTTTELNSHIFASENQTIKMFHVKRGELDEQ